MAHAGPPAESVTQTAVRTTRHAVRETVLIVVVALVLSVLARIFLVQAFFVPSGSMLQTLEIDDRIVVSKFTTKLGGVSRGEIVVFRDPGTWLPEPEAPTGPRAAIRDALTFIGLIPTDSGKDLVKRVIGVPGDRVKCCTPEGRISVNGVALVEPYLNEGLGTSQVRFDVTVPEGRLFVLGDNRASSSDSRYHLSEDQGTVPIENVVGRAVLTVWPINRFRTLPIPEEFGNPALDQTPVEQPSATPAGTSGP